MILSWTVVTRALRILAIKLCELGFLVCGAVHFLYLYEWVSIIHIKDVEILSEFSKKKRKKERKKEKKIKIKIKINNSAYYMSLTRRISRNEKGSYLKS